MGTVDQILDLWPSDAELARRLGKHPRAVQHWRGRKRIPGEYFAPLVALAEADGLELSFRDLALAVADTSNREQDGRSVAARQETHGCKAQSGEAA